MKYQEVIKDSLNWFDNEITISSQVIQENNNSSNATESMIRKVAFEENSTILIKLLEVDEANNSLIEGSIFKAKIIQNR